MKVKKIYYRSQQCLLSRIQPLIPWRMPKVISGAGSIYHLPRQVKQDGVGKVLMMTTSGFIKRGSLNTLFETFKKESLPYVIFDSVQPDPSIENIEAAVKVYRNEACEAIVAIGGGSVIDCAKVAGARIAKPEQSVIQMTGLFKIRKKLPPLYAVPTTAGTGSEVTVSAVITDSKTHHKYPVNDPCLIPEYAILDPELTYGMPQTLTADTGMDALTHAVEAYINKFASKESKKYALDAVKMIFTNVTKAYENGNDVKAREQMLMGSYYAGVSFTKAYVGYVHAIAHGIGGLYGVPHGHANAVILPIVLQAYGKAVFKELAELAEAVGIKGETQQEKAQNFILAIKRMNGEMGIQDKLMSLRKKIFPSLSKER